MKEIIKEAQKELDLAGIMWLKGADKYAVYRGAYGFIWGVITMGIYTDIDKDTLEKLTALRKLAFNNMLK